MIAEKQRRLIRTVGVCIIAVAAVPNIINTYYFFRHQFDVCVMNVPGEWNDYVGYSAPWIILIIYQLFYRYGFWYIFMSLISIFCSIIYFLTTINYQVLRYMVGVDRNMANIFDCGQFARYDDTFSGDMFTVFFVFPLDFLVIITLMFQFLSFLWASRTRIRGR